MSEDPFKTDFNFKCADLDSADLLEPRVACCDFLCSLWLSFYIRLSLLHSFRLLSTNPESHFKSLNRLNTVYVIQICHMQDEGMVSEIIVHKYTQKHIRFNS